MYIRTICKKRVATRVCHSLIVPLVVPSLYSMTGCNPIYILSYHNVLKKLCLLLQTVTPAERSCILVSQSQKWRCLRSLNSSSFIFFFFVFLQIQFKLYKIPHFYQLFFFFMKKPQRLKFNLYLTLECLKILQAGKMLHYVIG